MDLFCFHMGELVRLRLDCMAPVRRWEDYAARQGLIARAGAGLVRYVVDGVTRGTSKPSATRRRRESTGSSKLAAVGERGCVVAASISWAGSSTVAAAVSCTVVPSRRSVTPASPTGSAQPSSTTQRRKPSCQTSGSYTQQLDAATPGLLQSTGTHTSPPREGASACI